ncbi:hypothetical protein PG995_009790 [Apiospora arundinis]
MPVSPYKNHVPSSRNEKTSNQPRFPSTRLELSCGVADGAVAAGAGVSVARWGGSWGGGDGCGVGTGGTVVEVVATDGTSRDSRGGRCFFRGGGGGGGGGAASKQSIHDPIQSTSHVGDETACFIDSSDPAFYAFHTAITA